MTKIYDIIQLNNHLYVVDREVKIPKHSYFYASDRKSVHRNDWQRDALKEEFPFYWLIIATTDTTLGLPLLPKTEKTKDYEFEEKVVQIIKNILVKGQEFDLAAIIRDHQKSMIKRQLIPKQIEVEMEEYGWISEKTGVWKYETHEFEFIPKDKFLVNHRLKTKDNFVIVKQWIYEGKNSTNSSS